MPHLSGEPRYSRASAVAPDAARGYHAAGQTADARLPIEAGRGFHGVAHDRAHSKAIRRTISRAGIGSQHSSRPKTVPAASSSFHSDPDGLRRSRPDPGDSLWSVLARFEDSPAARDP